MTTKSYTASTNLLHILLPILSTVFIFGISLGIYYFSKGYRFNISNREITMTGVLTVKTDPSFATLYIGDEDTGRTPNSTSLDIGDYKISVKKDGYNDWHKDITILEQKSTLIYPWMVLKDIKSNNLWTNKSKLVKYWINTEYNTFLFLLQVAENKYSLWSYRVNTSLWDFNTNPVEILELTTKDIEIKQSNKGNLILLTQTIDKKKSSYILDSTKKNELKSTPVFNTDGYEKHTITWANDNRHLILESTNELLSYDTVRQNMNILAKKTKGNTYIWTTDEQGFFYIIKQLSETDQSIIYSLVQSKIDGSSPKEIIGKIYMRKEAKYVEYYRENGYTLTPFTNSQESTQTAGKIISILVDQNAKGVFIQTEYASYWYYIDSQKYIIAYPYPAKLISLAPDLRKALLSENNKVLLFTFDKDDADHTEIIGTEEIQNIPDAKSIRWVSNSLNIYFTRENSLYTADKDGGNEYKIYDIGSKKLSTIRSSRDHIVSLEETTAGEVVINEYRIH